MSATGAASMIEALERRQLFTTAVVTNGVLVVTGTAAADTLSVVRNGATYHVADSGNFSADFPITQVNAISIDGGDGNDDIVVDATVAIRTSILGGAGNDTING